MDISIINAAINDLEDSPATVESVSRLSSLYIVRDNLSKAGPSVENSVESELNDILPAYRRYVDVKRDFQIHHTTDDGVIATITILCKEIEEFITRLYASTDLQKERRLLTNTIDKLYHNLTIPS